MVVELETWSQIWKHSSRPKNGQGCENMVADLEKWSKIWLNGCRNGKMVADLEKNRSRLGKIVHSNIIHIWSQIWKNGQRCGKMVADLEKLQI